MVKFKKMLSTVRPGRDLKHDRSIDKKVEKKMNQYKKHMIQTTIQLAHEMNQTVLKRQKNLKKRKAYIQEIEEDSLDEQVSITSSEDSEYEKLKRSKEIKNIAKLTADLKGDKKKAVRRRSLFRDIVPQNSLVLKRLGTSLGPA